MKILGKKYKRNYASVFALTGSPFLYSVGLKGLEGYRIQVEVHAQLGLESITIVGLTDASVRESKRHDAAAPIFSWILDKRSKNHD